MWHLLPYGSGFKTVFSGTLEVHSLVYQGFLNMKITKNGSAFLKIVHAPLLIHNIYLRSLLVHCGAALLAQYPRILYDAHRNARHQNQHGNFSLKVNHLETTGSCNTTLRSKTIITCLQGPPS